MKILQVFLVVALSSCWLTSAREYLDCQNLDQEAVLLQYRKITNDIQSKLFKAAAARIQNNFVISPTSIYLTLSALVEGAEPETRREIIQIVSYPNPPPQPCVRREFYKIAAEAEQGRTGIKQDRKHAIIFDEGVVVNETWANKVRPFSMIDFYYGPISTNKGRVARQAAAILGTNQNIPRDFITGNSIVLDSLDYEGMLGNDFKVSKVEVAPFYDDGGQIIGNVEYVTLLVKAKVVYSRSLNAKILEIPVGAEKRFAVRYLVNLGKQPLQDTLVRVNANCVSEIINSQSTSLVPIPITFPRFNLTALIEVSSILEDLGVSDFWTNEAATRYVSDPPALPGSFFQRVTAIMDNLGDVKPDPTAKVSNQPTGLNRKVNDEFTANRPFLFGIFDRKTDTFVFSGIVYQLPV